jgi:hypothetical protein
LPEPFLKIVEKTLHKKGKKLHLKEKCRPDFKNTELGRDLLL